MELENLNMLKSQKKNPDGKELLPTKIDILIYDATNAFNEELEEYKLH